MVEVTFALLREGTSDDALLGVIRELIVLAGADEAIGDSRSYGGTTEEKLAQLLAEEADLDLVFVHRDADARDPQPRYDEIASAAAACGCPPPQVVGVVPVRMTETWVLCDEDAIRSVAGRPSGTADLHLPRPTNLERKADTKATLREALLIASETAGRRREQISKKFGSNRRTLLERLEADGPQQVLPSFQRLRTDIEAALAALP